VLITPVGYSSSMRTSFVFTIFCLFFAMQVTDAQAEVYKRVNPDGSVEFSDVPDKSGEKPVTLEPSTTYKPPKLQPAPKQPARKTFTGYESVKINQPENDVTIRDNTGNISVMVSSKPALQPGHSFILLMDGNKVGEGRAGNYNLTNLPRGSHTLTVQIQDGEGNTLIQSGAVTFFLKRFSKLLNPGAKKP
jgi:hypothetical protein